MLLSKISYRKVVKNLQVYMAQHKEDRRENPDSIPPAWGMPLRMMIEAVVREQRERFYKDLPDKVLEYLVEKGLLVRYAGDYTFPTNERLPTEDDIRNEVDKILSSLKQSK